VTAVRYTPNTHGCCPTEIASRRLDGRSRTQEECHLGKPKAESSIRIANVRAADMISATPVRVGVVVPCR